MNSDPCDHGLLPYQSAFATNPARFKIGLWARQTGKDHTAAFEAVIDSLRHPGNLWLILAAGERQARESLEKAKFWAQKLDSKPTSSKATQLSFRNDSRIIALPAKPETVRGYSANIILTEFAFHDDPEGIWKAVFPSVSNPLRGGEKKLRIITTPNGHGNFFHRLWKNSRNFFKSRVTIHDAIAGGLPLKLATLREGIFDPDAWAQEYECEFLDGSSVLLPYELIESCESPDATETTTPQFLSTLRGELFAGIDFGRKQDLTVCWLLEKIPLSPPRGEGSSMKNDTCSMFNAQWIFLTREVLVLDRLSTPAQLEILRPRIARVRRACVDYTGAGVGLGDLLADEFGSGHNGPKYTHHLAPKKLSTGGRIELCQFTAALKNELFPTLRAAFERGRLLIPKSAAIREDLHGLQKFVSAYGQLAFRAAHTSDGHSDRCTALALALRAAENSPPLTCASSIDVPRHRTT